MAKIKRAAPALLLALVLLFPMCLCGCGQSRQGAFHLKNYVLEEEGLMPLAEAMNRQVSLPPVLRLTRFEGTLNGKGELLDFSLNLRGFSPQEAYVGDYRCSYSKAEGFVSTQDTPNTASLPYNANEDLTFLDAQVKRLPLTQQIHLLDFDRYVFGIDGITKIEAGAPILDGGDSREYPLLTLDEYHAGQGGLSDGKSGIYCSLSDGVGRRDEHYLLYKMQTADPDTVFGERDFTLQCDYFIDDNGTSKSIRFTRDWGETWIDAELPEGALEETLDFYRSRLEIPEGSYSITETPGAIALLYGREPTLLLSKDDGERWQSIPLNSGFAASDGGLPATRRFVHFFDAQNGYVGLGTDWSMGTGEAKVLFTTTDGGASWQERPLPQTGTSHVLTGLSFADMQNGVVSIRRAGDDGEHAVLYYTEDGGKTWTEFAPPWEERPDTYWLAYKVDSLVFESGMLRIVFSMGEDKVGYQTNAFDEAWQFTGHWREMGHTVG